MRSSGTLLLLVNRVLLRNRERIKGCLKAPVDVAALVHAARRFAAQKEHPNTAHEPERVTDEGEIVHYRTAGRLAFNWRQRSMRLGLSGRSSWA